MELRVNKRIDSITASAVEQPVWLLSSLPPNDTCDLAKIAYDQRRI